MLEANRQKRMAKYEAEIGLLCYERFQLSQQIESCQKRIAEIDKELFKREGALQESEQSRRDIATEEAIEKAKEETNQNK